MLPRFSRKLFAPATLGSYLIPATLLPALALLMSVAPVKAEDASQYLIAEDFRSVKIKVDGQLREWPRGFAKLDKTLQGRPRQTEIMVGFDEKALYFAARTQDPQLIRTKSAGRQEDHYQIELRYPAANGQGSQLNIIDLYPGQPGQHSGLAKLNRKNLRTAQVVEKRGTGPWKKGYILEARIPWTELPRSRRLRVGLQARILYLDAERFGKISHRSATSTGRKKHLPLLTFGGESGLMQTLIERKGLNPRPDREAYGDLTGDGSLEKVALYERYLTIVGSGYLEGKKFYYSRLEVMSAQQVPQLKLLDLTGDRRPEIILSKQVGTEANYREYFQVLQLNDDGVPQQVFAHEVKIVLDDRLIKNNVQISGQGAKAQITISQDAYQGFEETTQPPPALGGGIIDALRPWQRTQEVSYAWRQGTFVEIHRVQGKPVLQSKSTAVPQVATPPLPRPPNPAELQQQVEALYRNDQKADAQPARFDFVTDVAGSASNERVLVIGRDLVVFGKEFLDGRSYTFLRIGVDTEDDLLAVTARDITGDGKAEMIVHARLKTQASEALGGQLVQRQALFIYKVFGTTLRRIFAAETMRELDNQRVIGLVKLEPSPRGVQITLAPWRAIGWKKRSYPFPEDRTAAGGLEPLLLPWGSTRERHYQFDGQSYVRVDAP
ncbi:MAG: hypothetical protein MK135_08000 [Polyangiaceae bacterium]|nr:hypothetical protein [Polyangiaceae bacterium]